MITLSSDEYRNNLYYKAPLKFFEDSKKCHMLFTDKKKINDRYKYVAVFIKEKMTSVRNSNLDSDLALKRTPSFCSTINGYEMNLSQKLWNDGSIVENLVYPKVNFYKLSETVDKEVIFKLVEKDGFLYAEDLLTNVVFPIIRTNDIEEEYTADIVSSSDRWFDNIKYECWVNFEPKFNNPNYESVISSFSFFFEKDMRRVQKKEIEAYLTKHNKRGTDAEWKRYDKKRDILMSHFPFQKRSKDVCDVKVKEEVKESINEKQSPINMVMENIESLLYKLGKVSPDTKRVKEEQYLLYLNSEKDPLTLTPPTYANLKALEGELEFILSYTKNGSEDIVETLENIASEYNEGVVTPRTIADIDELSKFFLKMKNSYSLLIQRKTIKLLSQLYIYEIYENRDSITLKDLNSSYFKEFIKTIILCINEMIDEGKIENNIFIDSDNLDEYYVLDLIKNIVFVREFTRHLSKEDCKE